jgi:hypothetical protein
MDNEKLNNIAQKVINKIQPNDQEKCGAIITILMVISIILTVIRVIQECNKSKLNNFTGKNKTEFFAKEIQTTVLKRTWFTKMMLKKAIRKELSKESYKAHGIDLMNAILDTGKELNNDELITLAEAANV